MIPVYRALVRLQERLTVLPAIHENLDHLRGEIPFGVDVGRPLILALETCLNSSQPHIGAFVLPPNLV